MGYETSYGFHKLHGSEENWEKFKKDIAEEIECKHFPEEECFYGRWYWDDARPFLEKTSAKYPDLLVEVIGEISEYDACWKARFKNGESEEVNEVSFFPAFTHGNLLLSPEEPRLFTTEFLDNAKAQVYTDLDDMLPGLLGKISNEDFKKFSGKNTVARFIVKAALEDLAAQYEPLDKDLNSKSGKELLAFLKAEAAVNW